MILAFDTHSTHADFKVCTLLWRNQTRFFLMMHNFLYLVVCGFDRAKALDKISHTPQRRVEDVLFLERTKE